MEERIASNRYLMIYLISCLVFCFLPLICVLFVYLVGDVAENICFGVLLCCPLQFFTGIVMLNAVDMFRVEPYSNIILVLVAFLPWVISATSVLCGAAFKKPWHIPAVILLCIDIYLHAVLVVGAIGYNTFWEQLLVIIPVILDIAILVLIEKIRRNSFPELSYKTISLSQQHRV